MQCYSAFYQHHESFTTGKGGDGATWIKLSAQWNHKWPRSPLCVRPSLPTSNRHWNLSVQVQRRAERRPKRQMATLPKASSPTSVCPPPSSLFTSPHLYLFLLPLFLRLTAASSSHPQSSPHQQYLPIFPLSTLVSSPLQILSQRPFLQLISRTLKTFTQPPILFKSSPTKSFPGLVSHFLGPSFYSYISLIMTELFITKLKFPLLFFLLSSPFT